MLVSAYGMCSKTCLPWQGRVYINDAFTDWSGDTRYEDGVKYGRSQYCGKWFPLLSSAIAEGLFHPNCRHGIGLYIDGVTGLPKPMDNSDIERRYKEEQHQRALERVVRKAKRRVEGFMEPADIQKAKADLREAQKNVREYIAETNEKEGSTVLVRQPVQEKIYGGDVRIGSSADPYEPPTKPAPFKPVEGFTAEVNIPAPENQTVEYTEQKIPERLKSAGTAEDDKESDLLKGSADIQFDRFDGSKAVQPELADEYRAEYDKFTEIFGELPNLNGIGVAPYKGDKTFGQYFPESRSIIIYGAGGSDGDKFISQTAQNNKSVGGWSTGSKYHSFRHELGHALQMEHEINDLNWQKKKEEIEALRQALVDSLTNDDGRVRIKEAKTRLSRYGLVNTKEFISECVAEYANNPNKARPTAKKVVAILMRGDEYYVNVNT